MGKFTVLEAGLTRFDLDKIEVLGRPCRPRILVLTESSLNYRANSDFGLWRFLHGLTLAAGVTNKPVLTLAYRGVHSPASIAIEGDTYNIVNNFSFATASPAVTVANYDQIWLFGIDTGNALPDNQVQVVANFMNAGGGVFATGDHAALGNGLCGDLPRIRRMREWNDIPMGIEDDVSVAVQRIDTVVNPGVGGIFEFDDQSDNIPQRIYPNYKVSPSGSLWKAEIHPLLRLPGGTLVRTEGTGVDALFANDMDVLPDHPHESICRAPLASQLDDMYTRTSPDFAEFQPSVADGGVRQNAEIVAYAVSGGRAIYRVGYWKPPVRPRMFGVICAYDGRLAQAYAGQSQRPGRIVCDSTWHHFVNTNLDGTGSGRTGLGAWSGGTPGSGTFTPSTDLQKIFGYYRNIQAWLQPANRVWCRLLWDLVAVRFNPKLIEELLEIRRLTGWRDVVGLGREAAQLIGQERGPGFAEALVDDMLLLEEKNGGLADALRANLLHDTDIDTESLRHGVLGAMLAQLARELPAHDEEAAFKALSRGPEKLVKPLTAAAQSALQQGLEDQTRRTERTLAVLKERRLPPVKTPRGKE
ncbi:hypothetical protein [Chitiniphilus eburneus]|uniref:Uncharacterized protein n=1 Tax=Chitiniphilus eburneus TaxID=2571148 RepID=A0A4U0PWT7_9NEIS|nr:hypothetical protein [Chitiniphilus eburneus]TJZ73011.1 hypothetical protein FAZ21_12395 [Chitiniphilus eburneus]